jgi:hypothetical protein
MSEKSLLDMPYNMSTKGGGLMDMPPPFNMTGKGMEGFGLPMDLNRNDFSSPAGRVFHINIFLNNRILFLRLFLDYLIPQHCAMIRTMQ